MFRPTSGHLQGAHTVCIIDGRGRENANENNKIVPDGKQTPHGYNTMVTNASIKTERTKLCLSSSVCVWQKSVSSYSYGVRSKPCLAWLSQGFLWFQQVLRGECYGHTLK